LAESLQDRTNILIPTIPDLVDLSKRNEKNSEDKLTEDYTQLFLNVYINSNSSNDLISVKKDQNGKLYIRK